MKGDIIAQVTALLDRGSAVTIVRKQVAHQLGTELKLEEVSLQTMNGVAKQVMGSIHLQIRPRLRDLV